MEPKIISLTSNKGQVFMEGHFRKEQTSMEPKIISLTSNKGQVFMEGLFRKEQTSMEPKIISLTSNKGQVFMEGLFFICCLLSFVLVLNLFQQHAHKEINKHRLTKSGHTDKNSSSQKRDYSL